MSTISIRPAHEGDSELVYSFICELADYERRLHEVEATVDSLRATVFGSGACSEVLIGELDGEPVGFALFFATYSTFLGREGIYLEDLYVRPRARGQGVGKRLLAEVARLNVERGGGRLEWSVLHWNTPSIEFYQGLGARPQNEWIRYRITGEGLGRLAQNSDGQE